MIYSNIQVKAKTKQMPFGDLSFLALGEYGRGRRELRLSCPVGTVLAKGMNENLTIGSTKSGNPKICVSADKHIYLILSSKGGYTRKGCGWIGAWLNNKATYQLIAKGNGADGEAGRIGTWDIVLLQILGQPQHDWLRINLSGDKEYYTPQILYLNGTDIIKFVCKADAVQFADERGITVPDFDTPDKFHNVTK